MRFHANVCPIGMGRPAIGLGCYGQVFELYRELSLQEWCIDVAANGFKEHLLQRMSAHLSDMGDVISALAHARHTLNDKVDAVHGHIAVWLSKIGSSASGPRAGTLQ